MSLCVRFFVVDPAEVIRRVPAAKLERLHSGDGSESWPEFSNAWACFAQVVMATEHRIPSRVVDTLYYRLRFGADGTLDRASLDEYMRLGIASTAMGLALDPSTLNGRPHFAQKKLRDRFHWNPTPSQERSINKLALAKPARTRGALRLLPR